MNAIKAFLGTLSIVSFKGFEFAQMRQIYSGFRDYDLCRKQVKVYAKQDISSARMGICKHTLNKGMSEEELQEWLDMKLNGYIFRYVIEGRTIGIPKEIVYQYATSNESVEEKFRKYIDLMGEYEKNSN